MKHALLVSLSFLIASQVIGQITPSKVGSTTQSSPTLQGIKPLEPIKQQPEPSSTSRPSMPPPVKQPTLIPQQAEYLHPGILVFFNGKWEGSDHLLNLSNNIGVRISVVKPESEVLDITDAQIQKEVEFIFNQVNIKPQILTAEGKPPLPAFEIEIFIYPIERGYVACCQGRLFESVTLDRFKMDSNMAFQAITWEKQHLIVGPKAQFADQLTKTVQDIATSFAERFQTYERFKRMNAQ